MIYSKATKIAISISVIACLLTNIVNGIGVPINDEFYSKILDLLLFLQKYSWPIILIVFIFAIYEYYIVGTEVVDHKLKGQRMIVSIAIFMAMFQCLPLLFAFIIVNVVK